MAITIDGTDGISPLKASGQTQTTTGTAAAPAIASSSDTDSGFFFGTNEVNISTGGSTRAKVDSSGRLLVGSSSGSSEPIAAFQGRATDANDGGMIAISRAGASPSGSIGELRFSTGDNLGKYYGMIVGASDGTTSSTSLPGMLRFSTTASGSTSPTERMRINAAGEITTPNQPSFQAVRSGTHSNLSGTDDFVPYNSTRHNRGNHYSTTTYRFTAPAAGHYLFFANVFRPAGTFGSLQLVKNNTTHYSFTEYESYDSNAHHYGIAIVDLNVNDYVHAKGNNYSVDGNGFFGGYLLG